MLSSSFDDNFIQTHSGNFVFVSLLKSSIIPRKSINVQDVGKEDIDNSYFCYIICFMSVEQRTDKSSRMPKERRLTAKELKRQEERQAIMDRRFSLPDLTIDAEDSGFDEMKLFDRAESLIDKWGVDGQIQVMGFYVRVHYEQPIPIKQTPVVDVKSTQYPDEKLKVQIKEFRERKDRVANTLHFNVMRLAPHFAVIPEEDIERNEQGLVGGYITEQTDPNNPKKTIRSRVIVVSNREEDPELQFFRQLLTVELSRGQRPRKIFYHEEDWAFQYLKQEEVDSLKQLMDIMKVKLSGK